MNLERLIIDIRPIIEDLGYRFEELHYTKTKQGNVLQVIIDHMEGIDIEDCVTCSEAVSLYLDETDPIQEDYQLEVTSPGAERPLKNEVDYQRFIGHYVLVKTEEQEFLGTLDSFDEFVLKIKTRNKLVAINRYEIKLIRLAIKF